MVLVYIIVMKTKFVDIFWNDEVYHVPANLSEAWDYKMFSEHSVARKGMYKLEHNVNSFLGYVVWEVDFSIYNK